MARPKLSEEMKKEKLNLTMSKEAKEMLDCIRIKKNISISEFAENAVRKEYKKLAKTASPSELSVKGQMSIEDFER